MGRVFLAHCSQMEKTAFKRLVEDRQRTVLLRPEQPLDDAMDSTVLGESVQLSD